MLIGAMTPATTPPAAQGERAGRRAASSPQAPNHIAHDIPETAPTVPDRRRFDRLGGPQQRVGKVYLLARFSPEVPRELRLCAA